MAGSRRVGSGRCGGSRSAARTWCRCPTAGASSNLIEIGGRRDGMVEAYRLTVLQDAGAYPTVGAVLVVPHPGHGPGHLRHRPGRVQRQGGGDQHHRRSRPTGVPADPRRAPPSSGPWTCSPPRSGWTRSRCVARNLIPPTPFPYTTKTDAIYDSGDYAGRPRPGAGGGRLRRAARRAGQRRRAAGDPVQLGIGVSSYVEVTAGPSPGETEFAKVEVHPDGRATVFTGSSAHGQGHRTSWAMIASDLTGIAMADIDVVGRRHRPGRRGRPARSARVRCRSGGAAVLHRHGGAGRAGPRRSPPSCSRPTRDDVVLDLASGQFHVDRHPGGDPDVGRGGHRPASGRPVDPGGDRPGARRPRSPQPRPRTRSAPTWPWWRSTPRPARSGSARWSPATTPAHRQPADRRGTAPRRHRPGRGPGPARGGRASTTTATPSRRTSPTTP